MMVDSQRGAELAITISYSTSASAIIVLLKAPKKLQCLDSSAVLADAYTYHICGLWYLSSYTMACKPIKTQELQYTMAIFFNNVLQQKLRILGGFWEIKWWETPVKGWFISKVKRKTDMKAHNHMSKWIEE